MLAIGELLGERERWQILDVRTPAEFDTGHIPGAINIPLFTNDERARIGTLYKQQSPESAYLEGLRVVGPKMADWVDQISRLNSSSSKDLIVHCWRGGKRSGAMHWLITFSGMKAWRLEGGYKSFRQSLHTFFETQPLDLRILGGCTGAGKTEIIQTLAAHGQQVIDLEQLAHHKGSAFGSIGELEQPTTEQFENEIYMAFLQLDISKPIWLENESKSIGKAHLPEGLWRQMRHAVLFNIQVDEESRLNRIMNYYAEPVQKDLLAAAFQKIKKRLGGLDFQKAMASLEAGDLRNAAAIALHYYDKAYTYQLEHWPPGKVIHLADCNGVEETAIKLMSYALESASQET